MTSRRPPTAFVPALIAFVVIAGFAFRLAFSLRSGGLVHGEDPDAYVAIAENLASGGGFASVANHPTAYRPPLYPVFLAAVLGLSHMSFAAAAVVQSIIGALIIVAAAGIADLLSGPSRRSGALIAAILVACDPFLIHASGQAMTETLFTFCLASALFFLLRSQREPSIGRLLIAAVSLSAAGLTRPMAYAIFPIAIPFALQLKGSIGRRLAAAACVLLVPVVLTAPWIARNFARFRAFIPTTTHGGYTLVLGNNPYLYDATKRDEPWLPGSQSFDAFEKENAEAHRTMDEPTADADMWKRGEAFIRERPRAALRLALWKVGALWRPAPTKLSVGGIVPDTIRYALGAYSLLLYAGAVIGLVSLRGRPLAVTLALYPLILFTLVHALFWSQLRFRIPLDPLLAALAAAGLVSLAGRIVRKEKPCAE